MGFIASDLHHNYFPSFLFWYVAGGRLPFNVSNKAKRLAEGFVQASYLAKVFPANTTKIFGPPVVRCLFRTAVEDRMTF